MPSREIQHKLSQLYALDRANGERVSRQRREEAYVKEPRLREVYDSLRTIGPALSRLALGEGGNDTSARALELREKQRGLVALRDELLEGLGITPSFFSDTHKCRLCKDTGFDDLARAHCSCLNKKKIELFYGKHVPSANETFDKFEIKHYSEEALPSGVSPRRQMGANLNAARNFAKHFVNNTHSEAGNLFLHGETGLGKTLMCNAIFNEVVQAGSLALYVPAPELFGLVEVSRFSKNEEEQYEAEVSVELLYDADLLIIDDLGSEFSTVVTSAELFNILNTRLLHKRAMIISSNLSFQNIQSTYSDRVCSRILGNFTMLKFCGEDMRLKLMKRKI